MAPPLAALLLFFLINAFVALVAYMSVRTAPAQSFERVTSYIKAAGEARARNQSRLQWRSLWKKVTFGGLAALALGAIGLLADLSGLGVVQLRPTEKMHGDFRIAVAGFAASEGGVAAETGQELAQGVYLRLKSSLHNTGEDIVIIVWGPEQVGTISGKSAEERASSAEGIAHRAGADLVIYGQIDSRHTPWQVLPEFFVATNNFNEADEVTGLYSLGAPLYIVGRGNIADRIDVSGALTQRAGVLTKVIEGLAYYNNARYVDAANVLRTAIGATGWKDEDGNEILYLLLGNATARAGLLDEAESAYRKVLTLNPQYARAYAGLGSVTYLRAISAGTSEEFRADLALLAEATTYYETALITDIQPVGAELEAKVAFGLGQVYLAEWFEGQDTLEAALAKFHEVIARYKSGNQRILDLAAEAYARVALADQQLQRRDQALLGFAKAADLTQSPSRRGLYLLSLGDLFTQGQSMETAHTKYRAAIEQFQIALTFPADSQQLAQYWGSIALCHEKLGEYDDATQALQSALATLPLSARGRQLYLDHLQRLEELRNTSEATKGEMP